MRACFFRGMLVVGLLPWVAGAAVLRAEPPNLFPHKLELRAYVERGDYERDIAAVAREAQAWLEVRVARGGARLTVVFDLDETLFLNWPYLSAMDFGYVAREWDRWVEEGRAPAVEPVREVYRTARRLGMEVVFLTGRPESARESTVRNLRAIGCGEFAELLPRPAGSKGTSAAFKTEARRRWEAGGGTIVANLGDQESDLAGGFAERTFKLPNPFYLTE